MSALRALALAIVGVAVARANYVTIAHRFTADPAPLVVNDTVYIYT